MMNSKSKEDNGDENKDHIDMLGRDSSPLGEGPLRWLKWPCGRNGMLNPLVQEWTNSYTPILSFNQST